MQSTFVPPESKADNPIVANENHSMLLVYSLYRTGITLVLWVLFLADTGIGEQQPTLFVLSGLFYLAINSLLLLSIARKWRPSFKWLLAIIASDILLIQLIAQASGGIAYGLSALMIVSVAAGSLFLNRKTALVVPAFASISLLISVLLSTIQASATKDEIVASGWLGFLFFIASFFISNLATRLKTSEARAEQEHIYAQNFQRLNALIIDRMQTSVMVVSNSGDIISCNQAAEKLFSNPRSNNVKNLTDIDSRLLEYQQSIQAQFVHNVDKDNQQENFFPMQFEHNGAAFKLTWIKLDDTSHSAMLIFAEDLSKIAQQAQQLKLSSLGKLTASIAHEIRNPLGAASHAAQLLKEAALEKEDERLVQIIIDQTQRCSKIIGNVLDVSRGKSAELEHFNLVEWMPGFIASYRIGKSCEINIQLPNELYIRFDPAHLEQILTNLLDNGLRHSKQDSGESIVFISGALDSDGRPRLDIQDTGNGVTETDRGRLFEPFFTRGKTGSGLGLYICRELCKANQASISYLTKQLPYLFRLQFSHPDRRALNLDISQDAIKSKK